MSTRTALPVLTSPRVVIRLLEQPDVPAVLAYHQENHEHLAPYSPTWPADLLTETFWSKQVERNIEEFYADQSCRFFLLDRTDNRTVIGSVGFGGILRSAAQFCFVGYGLAAHRQGQGLMSEALPVALKFAFDELNIHRIMANYIPTNERSGRLLKKLGFTVDGYARDYLFLNGKWQDHILTSLTNHNWKQQESRGKQ